MQLTSSIKIAIKKQCQISYLKLVKEISYILLEESKVEHYLRSSLERMSGLDQVEKQSLLIE
jgi:hypothetical protein